MDRPLSISFQAMTPHDVTAAINECREAGALTAAERLSKHIARIELQLLLTRVELQEVVKDLGDTPMGRRVMSHESAMLPPLNAGLHEAKKLGLWRRAHNWLLRLFNRPVIS